MSSQPTATPTATVTGTEILAETAPGRTEVSVQPLTSLQRAGLIVLLGLGIFSVLALIPIMAVWLIRVPAVPPDPLTAETVMTYDTAYEIAAEQPLVWLDTLFIKMIYPLVTLVLGYIFGVQQARASGGQ